MAVSPAVGLFCAILSAVFNGSFTVPFKSSGGGDGGASDDATAASPSAAAAAASQAAPYSSTATSSRSIVHPLVFNLYVAIGVFLSSCLIVPFLPLASYLLGDDHDHDHDEMPSSSSAAAPPLEFMFPAVVGGWLFVLGTSCSFLAIDDIGLAIAQGIWSGSATVVSYLWGTVAFGEIPSFPIASALGLMVLIAGVVGIAFCERIGKHASVERIVSGGGRRHVGRFGGRFWSSGEDDAELTPLTARPGGDGAVVTKKEGRGAASSQEDNDGDAALHPHYVRGALWACAVGLFGGSILAPIHYLPLDRQGIVILPSFGIGTLTLAPVVLWINVRWTGTVPHMRWRDAFRPGLLSGCLWNASNLLSVVAIPSVGYGVAYPLLQSAVLVSGLWGIYVFREVTHRATIVIFWWSGLVLLLGAATLAASQ